VTDRETISEQFPDDTVVAEEGDERNRVSPGSCESSILRYGHRYRERYGELPSALSPAVADLRRIGSAQASLSLVAGERSRRPSERPTRTPGIPRPVLTRSNGPAGQRPISPVRRGLPGSRASPLRTAGSTTNSSRRHLTGSRPHF
jgi:hypothetical protein